MFPLSELTRQIQAGSELSSEQVTAAADELMRLAADEAGKADFLRALAKKGESPSEIAAFARAFRARAIDPGVSAWAGRAIDVVGTGGDHAGGFNISTLVVFTLASAGVVVMKHGNRGLTSKCGSADLFSALGVDLAASPEKLRAALEQLGFVFFFAPAFHPSFQRIGPVRKQLASEGQRTIFNILGPLVNPGRPAHLLLGVFSRSLVATLALAVEKLGVENGLAGHGALADDRGIDEITTATPNTVRGIGRLRSLDTTWNPEELGFERSSFADLRGGDLATNLAIVESILRGEGPKGLVDTIVLNAAIGLWLTGKTGGVAEGVALAREQLLGGAVKRKIAATREFYQA